MTRDIPQLDMLDLAIVVMLADGASLSQVGIQVGLSPSALSHRLTRLSNRLGYPVTQTVRRQLRISDRLARSMPHLKAALHHLAKAQSVIGQDLGTVRSIGIARIFSGWAEQFLPDHSGVDQWQVVTGTSEDIVRLVRQGHVEAGMIRTDHGLAGMNMRILGYDPLMAVASPALVNHLPDAMELWPWIGFSQQLGHGLSVNRALAQSGWMPVYKFHVDALESALVLAAQSKGVAVLPKSMVSNQIREHRLVEVQVASVIWPERTVAALHLSGVPEPMWLSRFADRVTRYLNHGQTTGNG